MENKIYTVEELMLDEGFINFCLYEDSAYKPYWELVIEKNPAQSGTFRKAKYNIQTLNGGLSNNEILLQIEKVKEQLTLPKIYDENAVPETKTLDEFVIKSNNSFRKIFTYTVAASIMFLGTVYFIYSTATTKQQSTVASFITVYNTTLGERKNVELPDGSVIFLNTNSQLAINSNFNKKTREIELKGEAFFKVAKDASKPFIVHSNNFSTTAVGTEFYVHARNTGNEYKVDLLEGKVKVFNNKHTVMLSPGQDAQWNNAQNSFAKATFDSAFLAQWVTGKLSLDNTSVQDAVEILKKWYAVNIEVRRKDILKQSISGSYSNARLEDILKVICFTYSCKYTYENNNVIIQ